MDTLFVRARHLEHALFDYRRVQQDWIRWEPDEDPSSSHISDPFMLFIQVRMSLLGLKRLGVAYSTQSETIAPMRKEYDYLLTAFFSLAKEQETSGVSMPGFHMLNAAGLWDRPIVPGDSIVARDIIDLSKVENTELAVRQSRIQGLVKMLTSLETNAAQGFHPDAASLREQKDEIDGLLHVMRSFNPARGAQMTTSPAGSEFPPLGLGMCNACMDMGDIVQLACNHGYCIDCLKQLFVTGMTASIFPPVCCRVPISLNHLRGRVSNEVMSGYECRALEKSTPHALFCSHCTAFIAPSEINPAIKHAWCWRCRQETCPTCREHYHQARDCTEDTGLNGAMKLAATNQWQRCPHCQEVIEKADGCNHMECRCGRSFCYLCGTLWRACHCPQFDDEVEGDGYILDVNGVPRAIPEPQPLRNLGRPGFRPFQARAEIERRRRAVQVRGPAEGDDVVGNRRPAPRRHEQINAPHADPVQAQAAPFTPIGPFNNLADLAQAIIQPTEDLRAELITLEEEIERREAEDRDREARRARHRAEIARMQTRLAGFRVGRPEAEPAGYQPHRELPRRDRIRPDQYQNEIERLRERQNDLRERQQQRNATDQAQTSQIQPEHVNQRGMRRHDAGIEAAALNRRAEEPVNLGRRPQLTPIHHPPVNREPLVVHGERRTADTNLIDLTSDSDDSPPVRHPRRPLSVIPPRRRNAIPNPDLERSRFPNAARNQELNRRGIIRAADDADRQAMVAVNDSTTVAAGGQLTIEPIRPPPGLSPLPAYRGSFDNIFQHLDDNTDSFMPEQPFMPQFGSRPTSPLRPVGRPNQFPLNAAPVATNTAPNSLDVTRPQQPQRGQNQGYQTRNTVIQLPSSPPAMPTFDAGANLLGDDDTNARNQIQGLTLGREARRHPLTEGEEEMYRQHPRWTRPLIAVDNERPQPSGTIGGANRPGGRHLTHVAGTPRFVPGSATLQDGEVTTRTAVVYLSTAASGSRGFTGNIARPMPMPTRLAQSDSPEVIDLTADRHQNSSDPIEPFRRTPDLFRQVDEPAAGDLTDRLPSPDLAALRAIFENNGFVGPEDQLIRAAPGPSGRGRQSEVFNPTHTSNTSRPISGIGLLDSDADEEPPEVRPRNAREGLARAQARLEDADAELARAEAQVIYAEAELARAQWRRLRRRGRMPGGFIRSPPNSSETVRNTELPGRDKEMTEP